MRTAPALVSPNAWFNLASGRNVGIVKRLPPPRYIDRPEQLEELAQELAGPALVAVDTEADSFHHYREKVCLIQISFEGQDVLVDPLALESLEPLRAVLENPEQVKIFHDAGYDLIGLRRDFGFQLEGLFDTMWASRLLGAKSFGLASILEERFGFEVDKRLQRSDWARRPLTPEQIDYARLDTHFLPELTEMLRAELKERGRLDWAEEDFARMPAAAARVTPREGQRDPDSWWRVKGVKQLSPGARGRAQALWLVREQLAERLDRPPFKVFGDAVLIDLANNPPSSVDRLKPRKGLRRAGVERFGAHIIRALKNAEPVRGAPPPGSGRRRRAGRFLDPDAKERYEELRQVRAKAAEELQIDPEVVLANAVLEEIAREPPPGKEELERIEPLDGWRGPYVVEPILQVLRAHPAAAQPSRGASKRSRPDRSRRRNGKKKSASSTDDA